jgi:phosphohistidine phosphatase
MQIYLVQHGESEPEEIDPECRLTESGVESIRKVADFLRTSGGLEVDEIWHSGKPRAQQTAELLAASTRVGKEAVMHHDGLAPKDAVEPIKHELEQANRTLMNVGHLPFLGRLAAALQPATRTTTSSLFNTAVWSASNGTPPRGGLGG